jgi:hypothetical protein
MDAKEIRDLLGDEYGANALDSESPSVFQFQR